MINFIDRFADKLSGIERNQIGQTWRKIPGKALHRLAHEGGGGQRVRLRQLVNGEAAGFLTVELEELAVGLRAKLHATDVPDAGDLSAVPGIGLDDDVRKLVRVGQRALNIHCELKRLARRRGRHANLAGGNLGILLLNGSNDIFRCQRTRPHQIRVQPDAHAILADAKHDDVADARQSRQFVLQRNRPIVAQEQCVLVCIRRGQRDNLKNRGGFLFCYHPLLLNRDGQLSHRGGDAVLDEHLRKIQVGADLKGDGQGITAIRRAGGLHVEHFLHAVDLLFDRQSDGLKQRPGTGTGITCGDLHRRRRDGRILCHRQRKNRHGAKQHGQQRDDIGEHRPLNEEFGKHGRRSSKNLTPRIHGAGR